jgi:hypothetical protein
VGWFRYKPESMNRALFYMQCILRGLDRGNLIAWQVGWGLKLMWVLVHAIGLGGLLFLDSDLRRQTLAYSW